MDQGRSGGAGRVPPPADDTTPPLPETDGADHDRPIGFWLTLVDRLIGERFEGVLDEHGVTRRQWQLLALLERGPAATTALDESIAPFLDTAAGETSADHLAELVESGWVTLDDDDRYALTERGTVAHRRLVDVVTGIRDETTRGISPDDHATAVRVLRTAALNLGWTP